MALKTIPIVTEDIILAPRFMKDKFGRLCLVGQILFSGYQIKIHSNIETPAHQGTLIFPFTVKARNRVHNTELTIALLKNGEKYNADKQVELANDLLDPFSIYLESI